MKNPFDNESRLKAIIGSAIDGIITIDNRGNVESINPAAAKIFQYEAQEIIGQNIKVLMPNPDKDRHDDYISNYQKTGIRKIIGIGREVMGQKKDGTTFPFLLSVSEVQLQDKVIFTGIIHDISKLKEAENAYKKLNVELEERVQLRTSELFEAIKNLKQTNEKQKQAELEVRKALEKEKELNELKSRFVTLASHEFRTPLSTILSSVALIGKYKEIGDMEKIDKHIHRIKSSVTNLTVILNDFLSLSKLEEGIISNRPSYFNLKELAEELNEELSPMIPSTLQLEYLYTAKEEAYLDKNILKNILLNLLSNAIKYSEKGKIQLIIAEHEQNIVITVKDEGIGISKEDQEHLFTRFFRATNVSNIQGTGLGLNIVKRYVELLGGSIQLKSQLGTGTEVTLQFSKK